MCLGAYRLMGEKSITQIIIKYFIVVMIVLKRWVRQESVKYIMENALRVSWGWEAML